MSESLDGPKPCRPARDRRPSGQYDHARMDKLCVCGRTLGEHLAAYPHPYEDGNQCPRFRPKRTPSGVPMAALSLLMKPNPSPFDQSQPVKPGYTRVENFMDVANYDDALFQEYVAEDQAWDFFLNQTGRPNNPIYREAHFNTEHFENSMMARHWNFFVELRRSGIPADEARSMMRKEFKFD